MQDFLKGLKQVDIDDFDDTDEGCFVLNNTNELTHLDIRNTNDFHFEGITACTLLVDLYFPNNNLTKIPESISNLQHLTSLYLSSNRITEILEPICNLQNLTDLYLNSNNIAGIPVSIGNLQSLTGLELNSNKIAEIPQSIGNLKNLTGLYLNSNKIAEIPQSIGNLKNLITLFLNSNNITKIPESLTQLKKLTDLDLSDNPITKNIKEIQGQLTPQELISFLLEIQKEETKPLNEAKILVVGDERVGKTSVINRLLGNAHNPEQKSTFGIDILKHKLSNDIQVNIWDFAGQEITHQTHQFFLSSRSLYLYVLDSQKEDNDSGIFHWLNVIKANGGNSPIIIVVNKRDLNTGYSFDLNRYKADFNIVDVLYLSAENDQEIEEAVRKNISHTIADLTQSIETHVESLEDIKFPLPPSWAKVKEELECMSADDQDFIESDDYENLCIKHGIEIELLQDTLLTILNQIGTIVTYKGHDRLSVMQIINPLWVTNGVYKIIRSPLIDNKAVLTKAQFKEIFKGDKKYKTRHHTWLIDLLNQFELSFNLDDSTILIPSRLNQNQPEFDLSHYRKGLNFKYRYHNILKKSVISQFIVKMKDYISTAAMRYWQRGVFLQHGDANAVVISDEEKKTISIAIDTNSRAARELLSIVRHTFKTINGENLVADEEVPLLLEDAIVGYEDYDYLVECEKAGDKDIRLKLDKAASKKVHSFSIGDLLDGYRIKENTQFDYDKLTKDLISIALIETECKHAIYPENEDLTNDRFRNALLNKLYNINDQSRGGQSESSKSAGERDLVVRNSETGVAESIIEGFVLKGMHTTVVDKHYDKLTTKYDTTGNKLNFILVYAKVQNFAGLWQKYQNHFDDFDDTSGDESDKESIRTGVTKSNRMRVFHLFVDFYAGNSTL